MVSGIITGSTANSVIAAKIEWEASADNTTNSSTVSAKLFLRRTNTYTGTATSGLNKLKLQIGDTEFAGDGQMFTVPNNGDWVLACDGTADVEHDLDGTKTVPIKASGCLEGCSVKSVDCAEEVTLEAISRGSRIASFESIGTQGLLNEELKVLVEENSITCEYHKLRLLYGAEELRTVTLNGLRTTPRYTFYLTKEERERLYTNHICTDKVTLTAELTAYSDEAYKIQIGSADTAELELAMPDEVDPTLNVTVEPVWYVPDGKGFAEDAYSRQLYICGKTGMHITVEIGTQYGAKGSTALTVDGEEVKLDNGVYDSDVFTKTGKIELSCILTDSRGRTAEWSGTVTVHAYDDPKLTVTLCGRCNEDGELNSNGKYLYVKAVLEHTAFEGHTDDDNPCELHLQLPGTGDNTVTDHLLFCTVNPEQSCQYEGVSVDTYSGASIILDTQKSYQVQLIARDRLGEDYAIRFLIPTAKVQCHEGDGFLALGMYSDGPGVDIAADWPVRIWSEDIFIGADGLTLAQYIQKIIEGGLSNESV